MSQRKKDLRIHLVQSPAGQVELARRGLTTHDLATAIVEFQRREKVFVGTLIGVNHLGFFGSAREGWLPDQPDAFVDPLITIAWVQIFELLGRAPKGITGELLKSGGKVQ